MQWALFRLDDVAVREFPDAEGTDSVGVPDADDHVAEEDGEAVGPGERPDEVADGPQDVPVLRYLVRYDAEEDLGIRRRVERPPLRLELVPDLVGVHDAAAVPEGEVAETGRGD